MRFPLLFVLTLSLCCFGNTAVSQSDDDRRMVFATPISAWPITARNEILTAFPIYLNEFSVPMGFQTEAMVLDNISAMDHVAVTRGLDGGILQFCDAVRYLDRWQMTPTACMIQGGHESEKLMLLTHHRDFQLGDLRGKSIVVPEIEDFSKCYLRHLTYQSSGLEPNDYFGEITSEKKEVNAVIKVARRKADACLVSRLTLESMAELSPQIIKQLRTINESPEYPRSILAFSNLLPAETQAMFLRSAIVDLPSMARGRQLFVMFRVDGFAVYDESVYLEATEIVKRYDQN